MKRFRQSAKILLTKLLKTNDPRTKIRVMRNRLDRLIYRKRISLDDLKVAFDKLGVKNGRVVWIQSSWNEFYNFNGQPRDVIDLLLEMIGPDGTLVMPAIPLEINSDRIFEVDFAPVSTGFICEYFRRYPNVKRSIHLSSSVVALGPQADYLTKDHHKTLTPWDPQSPYERLIELDCICIGAGIGKFLENLTPLHTVEARLRHEVLFFRDLFEGEISYRWKTRSGKEGTHKFLLRRGRFNAKKFGRNYPKQMHRYFRISNLEMWSITARDAIETGTELGRNGITMYYDPKPTKASLKLIG